jgi:hypothetical protein
MRAHFGHLNFNRFQRYKELFNPGGFDPWNFLLKIEKSIKTPTPLGVCGFILSHFLTLPKAWNVTFGLHFWFTPLQAFALVLSPNLRLQQIPLMGEKMVRCLKSGI